MFQVSCYSKQHCNTHMWFHQVQVYLKDECSIVGRSAETDVNTPVILIVAQLLVMSSSLWPHGLQHTRLPCPSPSPRTGNSSKYYQLTSTAPQLVNYICSSKSFFFLMRAAVFVLNLCRKRYMLKLKKKIYSKRQLSGCAWGLAQISSAAHAQCNLNRFWHVTIVSINRGRYNNVN